MWWGIGIGGGILYLIVAFTFMKPPEMTQPT